MIYLYSGTPGSGKSLHMAQNIYWWLRTGHDCIANFAIDISKVKNCKGHFYELDNQYLNPENLIKFSRVYFKDHKYKEGSIRVFIDECQLLFNSRDWQMKGRRDWLSFFSQHRKYGYDIFLVAQFDMMIDKQIRSLIEYEFIHRKISNCGMVGRIAKLFMIGTESFVAVKMWYPMKERLSSEIFTANKKYYSLYDTFNTFDDFKGKEKGSLIPSGGS